MSDSRLNSVHLDTLRREEFRRVRDSILGAVGEETQRVEHHEESGSTLYHKLADRIPPGLDFVLVDKEMVYQLKVGINTVGRLSDNDVAIPDPYLSRRHCAVLIHASGECQIYDVASKNGTSVNGKKIDGPTRLNSGDEIRMCDRQYIFLQRTELGGASDRTHAD